MAEKRKIAPKGNKIIRVFCDKSEHNHLSSGTENCKIFLDKEIQKYPEIFPSKITEGYVFCGKTRPSKKLDSIRFRKIKLTATGEIYTIHPSFIMPNLIGYTDEVEKALLLRKNKVSYSTLVYIFGRNEMYWYRADKAFGKCNVVGTTVKKKKNCLKI
jgi:hypothetical protein